MKTVMVYSKSVNLKEFNFLNSNSFKSITFTYLLPRVNYKYVWNATHEISSGVKSAWFSDILYNQRIASVYIHLKVFLSGLIIKLLVRDWSNLQTMQFSKLQKILISRYALSIIMACINFLNF